MKNKLFSIQFYLYSIIIVTFFLEIATVSAQSLSNENFCAFNASLIFGDSTCMVGAQVPFDFETYCDNTAEDFGIWSNAGGIMAVRFTSPYFPFQITGGEVFVGDGSFPDSSDFLGTDLRVIVFKDDGPDNMPGTALDSTTVTVNNYNWVKFGGLNAVVSEGDFYLAIEQLNTPQNSAPIGVDTDPPLENRSYVKPSGGSWEISPHQDIMIKALTCYTDSVSLEQKRDDEVWYQYARISGFNPNNGQGPEDGFLTIIDSSFFTTYYDTTFYELWEGFYAYAIRKINTDVDTTAWYYSNVVFRTSLSVSEIANSRNSVTVYPNPANRLLYIKAASTIIQVSLFNAMGEQIISNDFHGKVIALHTNIFKAGIYFAKITTVKGVVNKTIVIQHTVN